MVDGAVRRFPAVLTLLSRHRLVVAVLVGACALRAVAVVAIYPGIWFSDSNRYVKSAATGILSPVRATGYSLFVAPFWHLRSAGALIVTQHLIGVAIVALLYALLRRRGVRPIVALLAVVPAALDAYFVALEHAIMAETVFHAALVGASALLLFADGRPARGAAGAAGLLLGYVGVLRSVGVPLLAVFVVYLLVRRVGWQRLLLFAAGWALVTVAYMTVFDLQHGKFALTQSNGMFLYGRVAPFADCAKLPDLPADERFLCPDPDNPLTTNAYLWSPRSPAHGVPRRDDPLLRDFAVRVIRHDPETYARVVVRSFLHYFEPGHRIASNDYPVAVWQFPVEPRRWGYPGYRGPIRPWDRALRRISATEPNRYAGAMAGRPRLNVRASRVLHAYQSVVYTQGPILAACVLLVLLALVLRRGAWRLRIDAALLCATALGALFVAVAFSTFSYRYGLVAALLLPPAAALAWTALRQGRPAQEDPNTRSTTRAAAPPSSSSQNVAANRS